MIFDCHALLFDGGKCEWRAIRGFVETFNRLSGTRYERASCLDVVSRDRRQPEVLLRCEEEADMVVERTSVVWPKPHVPGHKSLHQLAEGLAARLGQRFQGAPHAVCVDERSLSGPVHARNTCAAICDAIEAGEGSGTLPFPWRLIPAGALGHADGEVHGIGVEAFGSTEPYSGGPQEILRRRQAALDGFRSKCDGALRHAAGKFVEYPGHLRVVLLQFIGDDTWVEDEGVETTVATCADATAYDEVWVAFHDWISEDDYRVGWRRTWSAPKHSEPATTEGAGTDAWCEYALGLRPAVARISWRRNRQEHA